MGLSLSTLGGVLFLASISAASAGDVKQELLTKLSSFGDIVGEAKQPAGGNRVFYFQMENTKFGNTSYPMMVAITCTNLSYGGDAYCSAGSSLPSGAPAGFPPALIVP